MSGINTNRSAITLPAEISAEILKKATEESAVMRLARKIDLPGRGVTIPVITSLPEANWVVETGIKPVSNPGLSQKVRVLVCRLWDQTARCTLLERRHLVQT